MRPLFKTLDVPQTTAASPGSAIDVSNYREKTVQLSGFSAGTLQVHASLDGTNFAQVGADVTAPGFVDLPNCVQAIQIVCTVNLTGTGIGVFGGFDARTDGG